MNNEEAIKQLNVMIDSYIFLDECNSAMETAIEALRRRIPKKPMEDSGYSIYVCPICNDSVRLFGGTPMNFCCNCGQALDWGA